MHVRSFLDEIAAFAAESRRQLEAEVSGFETDPAASKARVERAFMDYEFFCATYFPHIMTGEKSDLHDYLFKRAPEIIDSPNGTMEAIAAPRGEAKSTYGTQLLPIWCVVTERKQYMGIIMETFEQSAMMLEAIKVELEYNPRLQQDFPGVIGEGSIWQHGKCVTRNNRMIEAFGSGQKIRGRRFRNSRPDLIILDDLENDKNVRSPSQRDQLESWIKKAVLKLGPPDGSMDVIYLGTVLHYDSVLNRFLRNPLWSSKLFRAIKKWPDRMDLWDQWEELLTNKGVIKADAFYRKNKRKMDAGAQVTWPEVRPLVSLMKLRADGHHAFDSEMQNDPTNDDNAPFKDIQFWVHVSEWIFYGSCDPSLGRMGKGRDPSALLVGGWNSKNGVLDVVEADISKKVPDLIIECIIQLQEQYRCLLWAVETVQFQEFMYTELVKRSVERGIPVPATPIKPITDKRLRIQSLQPYVAQGRIRLHRSQTTLHEQLRHFPEADHDDGPDGLEMLWQIASTNAGGIPIIKTAKAGNILRI